MNIGDYNIEKGGDGVYRVLIDTYELTGLDIHKEIEDQTKLKWNFYGHFMDTSCYGTTDERIEKFCADNNIKIVFVK